VHDVEGELAVVGAGVVHAEVCVLGSQHGSFAEYDDAAIAEGQGQSLGAAGSGSYFSLWVAEVVDVVCVGGEVLLSVALSGRRVFLGT
jgi:hypothetical protein